LDAVVGQHGMVGIRLYPGYHGYTLGDTEAAKLFRAAAERGLVVQIAVLLEDERMMNPLLAAPAVDLQPLAELVRQAPGVKLVLLNAMKQATRGPALDRLLTAGDVCVEIAMLEGVGGVERLLADWPAERVLFGSHAPYFYIQSSMLKLRESRLAPEQRRTICQAAARRLIPAT
jgi:predicted TIM-barrel fold metal-dependent hydrolase